WFSYAPAPAAVAPAFPPTGQLSPRSLPGDSRSPAAVVAHPSCHPPPYPWLKAQRPRGGTNTAGFSQFLCRYSDLHRKQTSSESIRISTDAGCASPSFPVLLQPPQRRPRLGDQHLIGHAVDDPGEDVLRLGAAHALQNDNRS